MKKLLLSLVALLALTSVSFAVSTEAQEKKNQLLPIVNLILNSNEYSDSQKSLVKSVIKNCATSNKNETIKGACSLIVEELEQQPENVAKPTESQKPIVIDEECDFLVVEQSDFNRKIIGTTGDVWHTKGTIWDETNQIRYYASMNNIDFEEALKRKREYLIMGIKTMLRDSKFIKDENRNELADEYFEKCYSPFASDHTQLQFINYAISQLFMHD